MSTAENLNKHAAEGTERERFDLRSHDIAADNLAELMRVFPEIRTEDGKIDFDRLRLVLGQTVDVGKERYGMNWPGKADCFKTIQTPSVGALLPCPEESIKFDGAENLVIDGDNLEVLKLFQKSYLGAVKMIYIDPPYNTGNEFIYPDKYAESLQTYLEFTGQADAEGRKFGTNTEADGRFHSNWLNMMYPRLYLARNLLRDDGVIFISIDDNEFRNLRCLCDEIFGEENFVATIIWQKVYAPKNTARHFSENHDYIVVYCKRTDLWLPELLPRTKEADARYENTDDDPRGPWKPSDMTARNYYSKGQYEVTSPSGRKFKSGVGRYWRQSYEKFLEMDKNNEIWWGPKGDGMPAQKRFLTAVKAGIVPQTLWQYQEVGHTQEAKKELIAAVHFEDTENVLNTVKPTRLLQKILQIGTSSETDDIVLDFFAGSASMGHAILKQNKADGGHRRFICVQLPEPLPKAETTLRTIADIGKQRLKHAISDVQAESATLNLVGQTESKDLGFRVFKLAESNFSGWDASLSHDPEVLTKQLELHIDHVRKGRSANDILYELLLKSGFPLTTPTEKKILAGKTVYCVADGALVICLERSLTLDVIRAIAEMKPERVVCLDEGFAGNDQLKANAVQTFRTKGVTSFKTV